ncbi:Protein Mo25 [Operophtera brumata]|uniref:Protein Mo25 n=1 Tax=Operophtera brumata TaxID=104452 RepID=A0A0L7LCA9_OPEBR|nr:Protein Mo25 [Operophtera brumata]
MPLFGKSQKSPAELVRSLKDAVTALERGDKKAEKAQEDVSKNLVLIKNMLYGTSDAEPQTDIIVAQLAQELYNTNLLLLLIQNLNRIDFEGKKDVAQVFNNVLRRQIGTRSPTVEYICTKPEILFTLMSGYEHQEIASNCGTMLRECARYEALAKIMLYSDDFYNFFRYVEVSTFDIASDAFSTFKVFVANPNKPKPILDILLRNQDKLVDFLTKFHTDRSEDEQFNDEKAYLIKQIKELKPLEH